MPPSYPVPRVCNWGHPLLEIQQLLFNKNTDVTCLFPCFSPRVGCLPDGFISRWPHLLPIMSFSLLSPTLLVWLTVVNNSY
jgi:hypothetical protein